jgi:2-octaprenyl-6-methoxyphenol hydroxylase
MIEMKDICILGGGLVGGMLGIALAKRGMTVAVVDRDAKSAMINPQGDGRTTAVNLASKIIFEELGLWEKIAPHAEPILDIKVYERGSPWSIHFNHQMLGKDPMGYIVENRFIRQSIIDCAFNCSSLAWHDETSIQEKKITESGVTASLANGMKIKASLLVGAEGRGSPAREEAGIKSYQFSYHQKALVFSVYHEQPHQGVAWEAFHPSGPMAFLPLQDCPLTHRHRSGVVWTLPAEQGDFLDHPGKYSYRSKIKRTV